MAPQTEEAPECPPLAIEALLEDGDLAVVSLPGGEAALGSAAWIEAALRCKQFVSLQRGAGGKEAAALAVVPATFLESAELPPGAASDAGAWVALRTPPAARCGEPASAPPLLALSSVGSALDASALPWRAVAPGDGCVRVLVRRPDLPAAAAALVRAGHALTPAAALCDPLPRVQTHPLAEEDRPLGAGAWSLQRREDGPALRIQARCGAFAEVHFPLEGDGVAGHASHGGCCSTGVHEGRRAHVAYNAVDFRPRVGGWPRSLASPGPDGVDSLELRDLSPLRGKQVWRRMSGGEDVVALELVQDPRGRRGLWLFCGGRFARVLGPKAGEGLVAGACCRSPEQLAAVYGESVVETDLRTRYEALEGEFEQPGLLRVREDAWRPERAGQILYSAADVAVGGSAVLKRAASGRVRAVLLRLPGGRREKWKVHEWAFDPFAASPPEAAKPEAAKPEGEERRKRREESRSCSSRRRLKKEAKASKKARESSSESRRHAKKEAKASRKARDSSSESRRPAKKDAKASKKARSSRSTSRRRSRSRSRSRSRERRRERERERERSKPRERQVAQASEVARAAAAAIAAEISASVAPAPAPAPPARQRRSLWDQRADGSSAEPPPPPPPPREDAVPGHLAVPFDPFAPVPGAPDPPPPLPGRLQAPPSGTYPGYMQQGMQGLPGAPPPPDMPHPMFMGGQEGLGPPPPPPPWGAGDVVGEFCKRFGVDSNAESALRTLPEEAQRSVMTDGSLVGMNPSALLMSRIRKVREGMRLPGFAGAPPPPSFGAVPPPPGSGGPAAPPGAADEMRGAVERYLAQSQVDASAAQALRSAPPDVQRQVLNDKPLQGCNNPSAVLMANLRRAMSAEPLGVGEDAVAQWASQNNLDRSAESSLRALPPELQRKVVEMGPVLGTNPSAILMGRVKAVRASAGLPGAPPLPGSPAPFGAVPPPPAEAPPAMETMGGRCGDRQPLAGSSPALFGAVPPPPAEAPPATEAMGGRWSDRLSPIEVSEL